MLTLTNELYIEPGETNDGSSSKVANEGLPRVDWSFSVYGNDFSHSYEPAP